MSGLPAKVSTQLRATGDAKELDSTVEKARLLQAIDSQTPSPVAAVGADPSEVQQLKDQLSELTQQVAVLATQRASGRSKNVSQLCCFNCDGVGHIQHNCPSPRRQQKSNFGSCRVWSIWTSGERLPPSGKQERDACDRQQASHQVISPPAVK